MSGQNAVVIAAIVQAKLTVAKTTSATAYSTCEIVCTLLLSSGNFILSGFAPFNYYNFSQFIPAMYLSALAGKLVVWFLVLWELTQEALQGLLLALVKVC